MFKPLDFIILPFNYTLFIAADICLIYKIC